MQQQAFEIQLEGVSLRGFVHYPDGVDLSQSNSLPTVLMGNGYATEWQFGTSPFISAATEAGFATVNFDYRGFGVSDSQLNQSRQIVDIPAQLDDWRAVVAWLKKQPWLKQDSLAIWGSSLGGGHALSISAETTNVAAVVAQVPHCDSREAFKTLPLSAVFKGMSSAMIDAIGVKFGAKDRLLPIFSTPDEYGVMNHPGWKQHYLQLAQSSKTWVNEIPARSLLRGGDYRPVTTVEHINAPALLMAGKQDAGVPFSSVETVAEKIKNCQLHAYEGDHFEVYHGDQIAKLVSIEIEFLQKYLTLAA